MFTVTTEAVWKEYSDAKKEPHEYLAVGDWTQDYGHEGRPRMVLKYFQILMSSWYRIIKKSILTS